MLGDKKIPGPICHESGQFSGHPLDKLETVSTGRYYIQIWSNNGQNYYFYSEATMEIHSIPQFKNYIIGITLCGPSSRDLGNVCWNPGCGSAQVKTLTLAFH